MQSFKGKTVVITGGASGIGRGSALAFAGEGANVVIADLNEARAAETVTAIEALGVQALAVKCDVSKDEDVARLRDAVIARFGGAHILMNNAGVLPVGAIEDVPLSEWERVLNINLLSVVRCTKTFLPDLIAAGDAHIVNTASMAGLISFDPFSLAYSASKAAVVSLSEGLAVALKPKNIGVTCLCPGPVRTNIGEHIALYGAMPPLGAYATNNFPGRQPDEVGAMVVAAVRAGQFLLPTNEEMFDVLRERAADATAFIDTIIRKS